MRPAPCSFFSPKCARESSELQSTRLPAPSQALGLANSAEVHATAPLPAREGAGG